MLFIFGIALVRVRAETFPQELYISPKGEVRLAGAELTSQHALNFFSVRIWGQKWSFATNYATRLESLYGEKINPKEILPGHILEVKGMLNPSVSNETGNVDASLVRDLSVKAGTPQTIATPSSLPPSLVNFPPLSASSLAEVSTPVKPIPKQWLTKSLRPGMRGPEVKILQQFLQKNGWGIPDDGPVTGFYGKVTQDAVKKFQLASGLEAAGTLGPKTRALINLLFGK
ncbi:MAG: peptidoglycan-binding protein [Candidatus Sungiibacteriota bacterium]|uniref:Peptidoglycan-binding protein n=1 Tax=Candidatus Sungiibacteriota bacterium TaxID=2750080 RepID=A0A7T5RJG4_9BACT|nr:MAG: peptidoglycan-binding protein [Candidatus Sungbacteria bacterium]